jgi:hypothetical protein
MGKESYVNLKIELDDDGGVAQDISQYVTSINGWNVERLLEDITGAGEDTDKWGAIGFEQKNEVELTGPYNDASDGLVALTKGWNDDSERTLTLTFDDAESDSKTVEVLLSRIQRNPARGAFHTYIVSLRPTGDVT